MTVRSNNPVNAEARASTALCVCFHARAGYWERQAAQSDRYERERLMAVPTYG
jgi:hypothetical protein